MASPSEEGTVYQEIMTQGEGLAGGLLREKNKFVTEDGYLVLVPRNMERKTLPQPTEQKGLPGNLRLWKPVRKTLRIPEDLFWRATSPM